jgi:hypothetical protein
MLPPSLFQAMQQTVAFATLAPGMKDGLGLFITPAGNLRLVGHHGGEPGFRADNEMVPSAGFAVSIVGNGNYNTNSILAAAVRAYFPKRDWDAPLPASAYIDGAPAVTRRMSAFLDDLSKGQADVDDMEVMARIAVPPIMHFMEHHRFERLQFISKAYTHDGILYQYRVLLAEQDAILAVDIASNGAITLIGMTPLPSRENAR